MAVQEVLKGLYRFTPAPLLNVYLLDSGGLTLIDTGLGGTVDRIVTAIDSVGRRASDVERIVVTHCHPDHYGGLAELKRRTGAAVFMHPIDAAEVRKGQVGGRLSFRGPLTMLNGIFEKPPHVQPAEVDREVADGEELDGGLIVVATPGHSDGHIALLWKQRGVLFTGDACWSVTGLGRLPFNVDHEQASRSLSRLSALDFQVACFGHGRPVMHDAAARFRRKWPAQLTGSVPRA